jgi:hypothetical protein
MDAENLANDSAKAPEPSESLEPERTTDIDTGDPATLRDVGAKLEPEHSEFDDPGFRAFWLMPVGLGIVLVVAALVMSTT